MQFIAFVTVVFSFGLPVVYAGSGKFSFHHFKQQDPFAPKFINFN